MHVGKASAEVVRHTPTGPLAVSWKRARGGARVAASVPPAREAFLVVPGTVLDASGAVLVASAGGVRLGPGEHELRVEV